MTNDPISFANDIRRLFRDFDITRMKQTRNLDLSDYAQVSAKADRILERLRDGDMPCDAAWPESQVDQFQRWIDGGKLP